MRVGVIVRRLSERGGLESNVVGLVRHLARKGHDPVVICQRVDPALDLDVERIPLSVPSMLGESAKMLLFARRARAELSRLRPDVSVTSGHADGVLVARLEMGLVSDYRSAMRRSGPVLDAWRVALDPSERAAAYVEARKIAGARLVLALSERAAESTRRFYGLDRARVRVVRNGVHLARFQPPSVLERAAARRAFGVDGRTLAFVGNGFARKGLDRLLAALAAPGAPASPTVLVAGHDRRARDYENRAKALGVPARFLGAVTDVRPVLAAADGLVLPTRYDPFGLVVLEALAMGIPVAVSEEAGASELIEDPRLVFSVSSDDHASLVASLSHLLDRAASPRTPAASRRIAEAHPLSRSFDEVEAALEDARSV